MHSPSLSGDYHQVTLQLSCNWNPGPPTPSQFTPALPLCSAPSDSGEHEHCMSDFMLNPIPLSIAPPLVSIRERKASAMCSFPRFELVRQPCCHFSSTKTGNPPRPVPFACFLATRSLFGLHLSQPPSARAPSQSYGNDSTRRLSSPDCVGVSTRSPRCGCTVAARPRWLAPGTAGAET